MEQIIILADGNSPMDMDDYGHALLAVGTKQSVGKPDGETIELETLFTKADFKKALEKVSRRTKR